MRTLLIAAASLGFSIAAASACDFHNMSNSAKMDTPDPMTVASIDRTAPVSKATGEAAKKLANPDAGAPASKPSEATE
jgi:hypothetical protein